MARLADSGKNFAPSIMLTPRGRAPHHWSMPSDRSALFHRLSGYWKLELANMIIIPGVMAWLSGWRLGPLSIVAILPMCGLLLVGGLYWRGKLQELAKGRDIRALLRRIRQVQLPLLALTLLAAGAVLASWMIAGLAANPADRWVATAAASLAALEYVNYYHRQLQHFDHAADFKRLLSGRGLRRSWLSRDIERLGRS